MITASGPRRTLATGIPQAWIKGLKATARYAGVSEKTASAWMKAGHLKAHALSRRLHLFRPSDVDRAVELAAQAYADASIQGQE